MAYLINKTTGELLITILDGTADGPDINPGQNAADIDLFGKNYPLYGELQNENFIKLLQNFANSNAPAKPLQGELWYDTSTNGNFVLRVFNGTAWNVVTPVWVSASAPITNQVGAQWWDSTNYQLNVYNGSSWTVVGPAYKAPDGKSGALVESVLDTLGATHNVIKFYSNNNVIAIVSYDASFTLSPANPIAGFSTIGPGMTLASGVNDNLIHGTAVNSQQLGNIAASNYARTDVNSTFSANLSVANLTFTSSSSTAQIINTATNGNISFYAAVAGVSTRVLSVNGATGEVTVSAGPSNNLGLVTKQYSDNSIATAVSVLAPLESPALTGVPTAPNVAVFTSNTAQVATMAAVQGAISLSNTALWQGSQKTVSTSTPTNNVGNPGDFWFQI
jgi:hypothetical protein